jgi:hypothetical protein
MAKSISDSLTVELNFINIAPSIAAAAANA